MARETRPTRDRDPAYAMIDLFIPQAMMVRVRIEAPKVGLSPRVYLVTVLEAAFRAIDAQG